MADETPTPPDQDHWSAVSAIIEESGKRQRDHLLAELRAIGRTPPDDETPTPRAVTLERHASNGDDEVTCLLHCGDETYVIDMTEDAYSALAAALDPRTTEVLFEQRDTAIEEREVAATLLSEAVELLLRLGSWGLHESKREDLHRRALDLHHRCAEAVVSYQPTEHPREDT